MHLVQAMHAGGGFLGHPLDRCQAQRVPGWVASQSGLDRSEENRLFLGGRTGENRRVAFGPCTEVQEQRRIPPIVEDHVAVTRIRPFKNAVGVVPVIFQRLALGGKNRHSGSRDGRSGVILGRKDVARSPAHFGTEGDQGLDQYGGLNRHVQRAGNARALEWPGGSEFFANRHQARHFGFGDTDFLAAPVGEAEVSNHIVLGNSIRHGKAP
ncbi:MAG: hypothetical protein AW09_002241 [Candidatus Accumulibacter phosphatis]|uniref:Uncharacterized protein n=1 Tax=Candidatus Accumulibacter phosphatis TaxID=327160 RepID=A0A080LVB4_9PROT|nr:MAG: hypothetical protein AW09_002241 [Candidatus Accumulibacter phosphatis]